MADEIIYKGGELDSVRLVSGTAQAFATYFDATYSDMSISLHGNSYSGILRSPTDGSAVSVSDGDVLWCSCYCGGEGGATGSWITVLDNSGRPAVRIFADGSPMTRLQHNTSATPTPSWVDLASFSRSSNSYIAFRIKTGLSKEFGFYIDGVLIMDGPFTNSLIAPLSQFTIGSINIASGISQIQLSRNVPLVHSRLLTCKANAAGTYQQMTGSYSNIVKTAINDATGIISDTLGQITTNNYEDISVPTGMVMHGQVWIWNRVRNSGGEPSSMKQACIVNSALQKSANLPVDVGFQGIPHVLNSMTPVLWNSCEVGQESSTL